MLDHSASSYRGQASPLVLDKGGNLSFIPESQGKSSTTPSKPKSDRTSRILELQQGQQFLRVSRSSAESRDRSMKNLEKKQKAVKEWLDSQNEEIDNAMVVSALVFTVAAAAMLQPHQANLDGEHTDMYGSLCAISVVTCLGSVLSGTVMKRNLRYVLLHLAEHTDDANHFIHMKSTRFMLSWPIAMMWVGAATKFGALLINVNEVFGETDASFSPSAITMGVSAFIVSSALLIAFIAMDKIREKHNLHGHYDGPKEEEGDDYDPEDSWDANIDE